ncbi:MAG: hypothetical protein V7K53_14065 [Nostoc sp.]
MDDIRLLQITHPRIAAQIMNLESIVRYLIIPVSAEICRLSLG